MSLEINCQNSPNLQSGYFVRTPAPRRAFLALQERIISFTWSTAVFAQKNLRLKLIGGYICSVAAKSATEFGSSIIHRRMLRPFKKWRFFCTQNTWKQNIHLSTLPNKFLGVSGGEPRARWPYDRSSNPPDAPFLFGSRKGEEITFHRSNVMSSPSRRNPTCNCQNSHHLVNISDGDAKTSSIPEPNETTFFDHDEFVIVPKKDFLKQLRIVKQLSEIIHQSNEVMLADIGPRATEPITYPVPECQKAIWLHRTIKYRTGHLVEASNKLSQQLLAFNAEMNEGELS